MSSFCAGKNISIRFDLIFLTSIILILSAITRAEANNYYNFSDVEIPVTIHKCCKSGYNFQWDAANNLHSCGRSVAAEVNFEIPSKLSSSNSAFNLTLVPNLLACELTPTFHFVNLNHSEETNDLIQFSPEGYLTLESGNYFYPPSDYCVELVNSSSLVIQVCPHHCKDPKSGRACFKKCCPLGQVIASHKSGCVHSNNKNWQQLLKDNNILPKNIQPHVLLTSPGSHCESDVTFVVNSGVKSSDTEFKLLDNGTVLLESFGTWTQVPDTEFHCIDDLEDENSRGEIQASILIACAKIEEDSAFVFSLVYGLVMMAASIFLLVAAMVNFLLWRKQNVHNWTFQGYVVSLFFMYIFVGLSHLLSALAYLGPGCAAIGGIAHYFFLSSFCWLSMINFDLWWKFRKLKVTPGNGNNHRKRLYIYGAISFLVPATIISVGVFIQSYYSGNLLGLDYGKTACYLEERSLWPYLYGPVSAILICNLMFFLSTIHRLCEIREHTRMATEAVNNTHQCKQVTLFLKIFCIMGVLWNFEVISYIVESKGDRNNKLWYWTIIDCLNVFQSAAIFFLFTWKRKVRKALEDQYPALKVAFSKLTWCCSCPGVNLPFFTKPPPDGRKSSSGSSQLSQDVTATTDICLTNVHSSQV